MGGGSYSAYARLFVGEILPADVGRIFYLDCDTIINGSLGEIIRGLRDTDESYTLYGVRDVAPSYHRRKIGLKIGCRYVNTGMLLIDMRKWRERSCGPRILDHIKNVRAAYPYVDQDIINVVLEDEIGILPLKYNCHDYMGLFAPSQVLRMACVGENEFYTEKEIAEAVAGPSVIHFTGSPYGRPWLRGGANPFGGVWDKYLALSPWKDYEKKKYVPGFLRKGLLTAYGVLPNGLYSYLLKGLKLATGI